MEPQEEVEDQLIFEAEETLRQKRADYDAELRMQHQLLRQIKLLESVAKQDSLPDLMHRMTLQTLTATAPAAAAEAGQHAAPVQQRPPAPISPPAPAPAPAPAAPLQLEDLPLSLSAFDDKLLQRVADMTLEDCIAMYTAFVKKNQFAVTHVKCHGDASYLRQEMGDSVTRICNLLLLLGFLLLPLMSRLLSMNFVTLQEDEAPHGWYARVAGLIPVHAGFAAVVQAGVASAQSSVNKEVDSSGDVLQQLRRVIQSQDASAEPDLGNLDNLDGLLDRFNRCANSVLLLRSMVSVYLFAAMQRIFHPVVLGETFISCWPYSIRGMVIFEEYLKRDDVQAAIQPTHGGVVGGDGSGTATADSNSNPDLISGCSASPTQSALEGDSTSGSVCS